MLLAGKTIGFGFTGSHCRVQEVIAEVQRLRDEGARVIPVYSPAINTTSSRFYDVDDFKAKMAEITGEKAITTILEAEPIGPRNLLDAMVVAPATGNTLAKMANAITDTAVLMACKATIRNDKPVVVAVSTNDGLGGNGKNIGALFNARNVFFVPFGQDDPVGKPTSLVALMDRITDTIVMALQGRQIQPVMLEAWKYPPNSNKP